MPNTDLTISVWPGSKFNPKKPDVYRVRVDNTPNRITLQKKKLTRRNYITPPLRFGIPDSMFLNTTAFGIDPFEHVSDVTGHLFRYFRIKKVGYIKSKDMSIGADFELVDKADDFINMIRLMLGDVDISRFKKDPIEFAISNYDFSLEFDNTYSESLLESINSIMSEIPLQIRQLFGYNLGQSSITKGGSAVIATPFELLGSTFGVFGKFAQFLLGKNSSVAKFVERVANAMKTAGNRVKINISHLAAGDIAAFPRIWRGSSFTNSYSISITLMALTEKPIDIKMKILTPLAILTLLATPLATGSMWFSYPFYFSGEIEGFREIKLGAISSLSINFGSGSLFSASKKYLMVNVNLSIVDLYPVMVTPNLDMLTSKKASANATSDLSVMSSALPNTKEWFSYLNKFLV